MTDNELLAQLAQRMGWKQAPSTFINHFSEEPPVYYLIDGAEFKRSVAYFEHGRRGGWRVKWEVWEPQKQLGDAWDLIQAVRLFGGGDQVAQSFILLFQTHLSAEKIARSIVHKVAQWWHIIR